jgi:hypothetical protein
MAWVSSRRLRPIEHDRRRALEQAVEMTLQESWMAGPHPQPLPDAVAKHEARVECRHHRPSARHQIAVDPHGDVVVAGILLEVMRSVRHAPSLRAT